MIVGRVYLERGREVTVLVQWGLKSLGQTHGGPRNVLVERWEDGSRVVRPFRGLRAVYDYERGNRVPMRDSGYLDAPIADPMLPCAVCRATPVVRDQVWADDPCIASLPDVTAACCGHGQPDIDTCYLLFKDGVALYGNAARAAMEMLGGAPPPKHPDSLPRQSPVLTSRDERDPWAKS